MKVRKKMLILTENEEIINLDNIATVFLSVETSECAVITTEQHRYAVNCELLNGDQYAIKEYKTKQEAKEALDKILNQCDRGHNVIRI